MSDKESGEITVLKFVTFMSHVTVICHMSQNFCNKSRENHWLKNCFSFTETDKYEIWQRFWHLKQERCEELNELITEAIKWLKKSKEAELDLAKHDHNAEDQFAKLHRIRHRNIMNRPYRNINNVTQCFNINS